VAFGVRREEFAALQAWRRGGAEIEMVVTCPELLLPATPFPRAAAAGDVPDVLHRPRLRPPASEDYPNLQLPGDLPLLLSLFLIKIASYLLLN
jgi:hypothetical protein